MKPVRTLLAVLCCFLLWAGVPVFAEEEAGEKNGEVYILVTSDVHCGVDQGFGYAGLWQVREELEEQGYTTLLVDDGDSIQGEPLGTLSKGEAIVDLMNDMRYDVAIPGNHEFDYGTDRFLELVSMAEYPYISCNLTYQDELVLEPYVIKEAAGLKIGFVGVTTPKTLTNSTPVYFQDENGEFVYGFMQDDTGEALYAAVQSEVDAARADGADLVYVMGHLGLEADCVPWTYADLIAHTRGIDVFLDGHSHDTEQIVMKNMDGEDVPRCAVGTKLNCIGYSHISAEGEVLETGILSWPNSISAPVLLGLDNEINDEVKAAKTALSEQLDTVVAQTQVDLTIYDPVEKDNSGNPVCMIRRGETNLGDLCADAYRDQSGADIAVANGGGIRVSIPKGEVTFGDIIKVHPFGKMLCVVEVTGQQILDALEWGSRNLPGESGGFLQVSGLTYEIHTNVESSCTMDENGMFTGVAGEYRVQNVMVGDEPLDLQKTYTLASQQYTLLENGDGNTAFHGAPLLQDKVKLDNQVLIDYITGTLGGVIGEEYADPYGQGRIVIVDEEETEAAEDTEAAEGTEAAEETREAEETMAVEGSTEEAGAAEPENSASAEAAPKRKLIIDTDTGADDASALILAACSDEVEILGVTVLTGNVDLEQGTKNALMALEMAGVEVPVYQGETEKASGETIHALSVFGTDGMGDADLIHPAGKAQEGDAVSFILDSVRAYPGEVEIVALGPATNVAKAIQEDPETMKQVKRIWSMGSAGLGPGNASPVAEFNVYGDPIAYKTMLDSGIDIVVVGLDVCGGEAQWTDEQFEELAASGEIGAFVVASFGKIREFYAANGSAGSVMNCDSVAMLCALDPDFVEKTISCHGSCITDLGDAYAQVIFYQEGFTYDLVANDFDYNVTLVNQVKKDEYFQRYLERIR